MRRDLHALFKDFYYLPTFYFTSVFHDLQNCYVVALFCRKTMNF